MNIKYQLNEINDGFRLCFTWETRETRKTSDTGQTWETWEIREFCGAVLERLEQLGI